MENKLTKKDRNYWSDDKVKELVEKFITKYSSPEMINIYPTVAMFRYQTGMPKATLIDLKKKDNTGYVLEQLYNFIQMRQETGLVNDYKNSRGCEKYLFSAFRAEGYGNHIEIEQANPNVVVNTVGLDNILEELGIKEDETDSSNSLH